jgi:hypothetical protein
LKQVSGFTKSGDIKLANGWVISKDHGNLTHGYCVTSYGAQSKGVDRVFVAESSESFRAADRQQFYVSASRFKESLTIYTDDKQELLKAVSKSSERPSATDLMSHQFRTVRPMREKRVLRPSRLSAVQRLADEAEQARQGVEEMLKADERAQTVPEHTQRVSVQTVSEHSRHAIKHPIQPQHRSRGISH